MTHLSNGPCIPKLAGHGSGLRLIIHEPHELDWKFQGPRNLALQQKRLLVCRKPTGMMTFDKNQMILSLALSEANQG